MPAAESNITVFAPS